MTAPSTTSTTLPTCNYLRVTSLRVKPRKDDPSKARVLIRGVLADAGWVNVDPKQSGVNLGLATAAELSACCTVDQQLWMRPNRVLFDFWDKRRGICPPLADMQIYVRRTGRATFKLFAPQADMPTDPTSDFGFGVAIGDRCSTGALPLTALRPRRRALVYP